MRLADICKSYGENTVFSGFSAELKNGCFTWITGGSGCGKTTLLRIISGLEEYSGRISDIPGKRISMVFQEDRLFEELSALENCLLVSELPAENIKGMLMQTGLSCDDILKSSRELSGGMKRRTAVVRALCAPWDILLMDEPFKGLDKISRMKTAELVKNNFCGRTAAAVTHDISDMELISGEILNIVKYTQKAI